jgi:alpha-tubulin suppressor-like RCC1 family protein
LVGNSSGQVYAWGGNPYGVLGQNSGLSTSSLSLPTLVKDAIGTSVLSNIVQLAAGYININSFGLNEAGNVYSWGSNSFAELG